jgi:hypothetical protein
VVEAAAAHRWISQERLGLAAEARTASLLGGLARMLNWHEIAGLFGGMHTNTKGESAVINDIIVGPENAVG